MPLVGLKSIVFKPANIVWPDETPPSSELAALFDSLPGLFELEIKREQVIRDTLDKITSYESLQPSQELRRLYWSGRFCALYKDHRQAFELFTRARQLAEDHHDSVSILEMGLNAAEAQFNHLLYVDALDTYREILDIWQHAPLSPSERRLDTEIQLRAFVCRQAWLVGESNATHGDFAHTLTKAMNAPRSQKTPELLKETANGLWDFALALRADSDLSDGNLSLLKQASRRMRLARDFYIEIGVPHNHLARLDIQLAEIYYDIAELHMQRNKGESARSMRARGDDLAKEAREFLAETSDRAAPLLAEITSLRPDIMWPQRSTPEEIDECLTSIERRSAEMHDQFLIAKAATLRAEWLMTLGEFEKARAALTLAIDGFGLGGKGMATRTERLMRQLPPIHGLENSYSTADPERNGHN